jgi:hydroxymethylbilane synthase
LTLSAARLRIGTRGSPLALAQARDVMSKLKAAHALDTEACEIVVITTTGDQITERPLLEAGGKGLLGSRCNTKCSSSCMSWVSFC